MTTTMIGILFLVLALQLLCFYFLIKLANYSWAENQRLTASQKEWEEPPVDEYGLFFSCNEQAQMNLKQRRHSRQELLKQKTAALPRFMHSLLPSVHAVIKPVFCTLLFILMCISAIQLSKTHGKGQIKHIAESIMHKAKSY
jgi:hypothetical protein